MEGLALYHRKMVERADDIARREVMAFVGLYPGATAEELEDLMADSLAGRYEIVPCSRVQAEAEAYRKRLKKAGNLSLADDVKASCQLPILEVYPQDGEFREEELPEYADRCGDIIRTHSIAYHKALKAENRGVNYQQDVLSRRN